MPSSPVQSDASPPASPRARFDSMDFLVGQSKKTLEWACAAARLAERTPQEPADRRHASADFSGSDAGSATESASDDGPHDAVTPASSQSSMEWVSMPVQPGAMQRWGHQKVSEGMEDLRLEEEDVMHAAWALCGLSRR